MHSTRQSQIAVGCHRTRAAAMDAAAALTKGILFWIYKQGIGFIFAGSLFLFHHKSLFIFLFCFFVSHCNICIRSMRLSLDAFGQNRWYSQCWFSSIPFFFSSFVSPPSNIVFFIFGIHPLRLMGCCPPPLSLCDFEKRLRSFTFTIVIFAYWMKVL